MALAKLPKAFGLNELKKGFFPYLFCTVDNQHYVGPMPAKEHYDPKGMGKDKKREFELWYETQTGKVFDMQKELLSYCISDVDILQRACGQFRDKYHKHTKMEPFAQAITLP